MSPFDIEDAKQSIGNIIGEQVAKQGGVTAQIEGIILFELQRMQLATSQTRVVIGEDSVTITPTRVGPIKITVQAAREVIKIDFDDEAMKAYLDALQKKPAVA